MFVNQRVSELVTQLGAVSPISQAAGTATSAWLFAGNFHAIAALISVGVMGAGGTVDANWLQATSAAGAGSKAIAGKAITQIQQAVSGNNNQAWTNFRTSDLDVSNGFDFVQLQVVVGTATSLISAAVLGLPRYEDANALSPASVLSAN